ncbi:MAG: hypothetical protein HY316_04865 [Acidobacteria bacterium]|nr:hypothetical protein [Acidobacteriota bacterium]
MEDENRWINAILFVGLLCGIAFCLYRISTSNPTPNEALLLSVLLTIFSILGSWIASRHYAEYSFNRSQRLFALKAAEKVTNLSRELDRLSYSLQEELKANDYESPKEDLLAKQIRIEGAIHVLSTLKSVNEGSLSDWKGVIGEEINAKLQDEEDREEDVRDLLSRLESVTTLQALNPSEAGQDRHAEELRNEVNALRQDLRSLAAHVSGVPLRQSPPRVPKQVVERNCPVCSQLLRFRQRAKPSATKGVKCTNCGSALVSLYSDGEFVLTRRNPVPEQVECPMCKIRMQIDLDPVPGGSDLTKCNACDCRMRVTRTGQGIKVKLIDSAELLNAGVVVPVPTEEVLEQIRQAMGPQPWPQGKNRMVADSLGLSRSLVERAVTELIRRGVFKLQKEGKLYVPYASNYAANEAGGVGQGRQDL